MSKHHTPLLFPPPAKYAGLGQMVREAQQARASDPQTSKAGVDVAAMDETARTLLRCMIRGEPYTDEGLWRISPELHVTEGRVRHARLALSRAGLIVEAGFGETSHGAKCRTWRLA